MTKQSVMMERVYDAPSATVWEALTSLDQLRQWYFNLDDFKPEVGFQFRFSGKGSKGELYIHLCTVTEVVPNEKLQYTWKYENFAGESVLTWQLYEAGAGKTKLVLTHNGLETFPQDNPDFAPASFTGGWNHFVNKALVAFLEK